MWVTPSFCSYTYTNSYISVVVGFQYSSSFKDLCIVVSDFVPSLFVAVTCWFINWFDNGCVCRYWLSTSVSVNRTPFHQVFTPVTVIMPVVIYGWNFVSHRLRVFENRVLRRIFGSEREEVTGGLQKSQLPDRYISPNFIWVIKLTRLRWPGAWHTWGRGDMHRGHWLKKIWRKQTHFEDLGSGWGQMGSFSED